MVGSGDQNEHGTIHAPVDCSEMSFPFFFVGNEQKLETTDSLLDLYK